MDKPKFWDLWWFQMGSNTARTQNQRGFQGIWDWVSLDKCCDFITSWNSTDSPNPQKIRTGFSWRFSLSPHQGQSCKSMGFMECWVLVSDGRLKPAVFWLLAGFSLKNISNIFQTLFWKTVPWPHCPHREEWRNFFQVWSLFLLLSLLFSSFFFKMNQRI